MSGLDKWKNKMWVKIKMPTYIDDIEIGETMASEAENTIGRTIKMSVMDYTNNFKDMNKRLIFKIIDVKGTAAVTEFKEFSLSRDYVRSLVRNHRSRIDGIFNVKLKDDAKVRITVFCITPIRAKASEQKEIRQVITKTLYEQVEDLNFQTFVNKIINEEFNEAMNTAVEEIFPTKTLEIAKVKVIRLPTE